MQKLGLLRSACVASVFCAALAVTSPAQSFTTLLSFDGTNGAYPGGLVQGADGNFYGITGGGGATNACLKGSTVCGTIFEMTPSGTLTTLQSFSSDCSNGCGNIGLVQGTDGKFYGTASSGGANGYGTFFSIVPGGTLVTLYSFCSQPNCADGYSPKPGLIQGTDGNFYGTTSDNAQPNQCLSGGCGTVFKVTPTGTLTTLYTFPETSANPPYAPYGPYAGLVQGTDGNFYGTTQYGGNDTCPRGQPLSCGTVFQMTPGGTLTTLYDFCGQAGCSDAYNPGGLVLGRDGNFYGTTPLGGDVACVDNPYNLPCGGTVFQITPEGTLTTLHRFIGIDGNEPSGVVQGSDGNFYGTTFFGGANNAGRSSESLRKVLSSLSTTSRKPPRPRVRTRAVWYKPLMGSFMGQQREAVPVMMARFSAFRLAWAELPLPPRP